MRRLLDLANLVLLFLIGRAAYLAWPRIPDRLPLHFDFAGRPDRWGTRSALLVFPAVALGLTVLFYVLSAYLPRLARHPRNLNIPHKDEFLKLSPEKQAPYWGLIQEFLIALCAGLNLMFYLILIKTVDIALGLAHRLPFRDVLPGLIAIGLIVALYLPRLLSLPGRLIRGDEP
jgi:uncharacterized membrane protein